MFHTWMVTRRKNGGGTRKNNPSWKSFTLPLTLLTLLFFTLLSQAPGEVDPFSRTDWRPC
jgi:hypothetical protein